jgi:hypothetical protein
MPKQRRKYAQHKVDFIKNQEATYASLGASPEAARYLAAQDALETGYGTKTVGKYNFGNMTTVKKGDKSVTRTTTEYREDGTPYQATMRYKSYDTPLDYAKDKVDRLQRKWGVDIKNDDAGTITGKIVGGKTKNMQQEKMLF